VTLLLSAAGAMIMPAHAAALIRQGRAHIRLSGGCRRECLPAFAERIEVADHRGEGRIAVNPGPRRRKVGTIRHARFRSGLADGVGFEPTRGQKPLAVFKTAALNHSATHPFCNGP
jgi:hypothetical protein